MDGRATCDVVACEGWSAALSAGAPLVVRQPCMGSVCGVEAGEAFCVVSWLDGGDVPAGRARVCVPPAACGDGSTLPLSWM